MPRLLQHWSDDASCDQISPPLPSTTPLPTPTGARRSSSRVPALLVASGTQANSSRIRSNPHSSTTTRASINRKVSVTPHREDRRHFILGVSTSSAASPVHWIGTDIPLDQVITWHNGGLAGHRPRSASLTVPTSPNDIPSTFSDHKYRPSTAPSTVMAEQIRHNVVNGLESAGASAPADVALNTTTITSAADGSLETNADPTDLTTAKSPATGADLAAPTSKLDALMVDHAADPSAGEAAEIAVSAASSKRPLFNADMPNGSQEHATRGEGLLEDGRSVTPDVSVDHSVQSDTDVSREDASEQQKETYHSRTDSVKKPTTFSKISTTKTFLAKSATPVAVVAKVGEKTTVMGVVAAPLARPRLVAKSGSGLQSMQKARVGVESKTGPDASKVWNKNRPVAPPPPKHLTDEELKQQYGIHLATRLQSDENGKDSKWADIDDDDDDWAPEAVVWMDGTKSSLAPPEPEPEVEPEQKQEVPLPAKPAEPTRPDLSKLKKATIPDAGPPKTILKPGVAAQQAKQQIGVVTSTGAEKPLLKAKSPAPTPVKSPWAPIAPVAAVSPITLPVQQHQVPSQHTTMASQDARTYEMAPPSAPAREIAVDTFDRSWREGEGGSRELFNSANGRYEPAPEGRRSSVKPDGHIRKPAVLQRPSQIGAAPAEPSAAFQARNGGQMDGTSWQRRRGSSISQGGSLPPGRRTSTSSKMADHQNAPERRGSVVAAQHARATLQEVAGDPDRPTFSQQSPWEQQMPAVPRPELTAAPVAPVVDAEDPVKTQERVMKEKRESAKKRRLEEEARMEQEKQERLKARLAALEGAGKSRKEREAEAASLPAAVVEKPTPPPPTTLAIESTAAHPPSPVLDHTATTTTTSDVPVAPDDSLAKAEPRSPTSPILQLAPVAAPSAEHSDANQRQTPRAHLSPRANVRAPFGPQSVAYRQPTSSYSSPGDRKSQPFSRSPLTNNDNFSSWATSGPGGSVWGSSGIGNGTFETSNSFAPLQQNSTLPPPPGMNRMPPQSFTQGSRSPSLQHQQLADQQRTFAPPPGMEPRQESTWGQPRGSGVSPTPGFGRPNNLPAPIGPPSRAHQQQPPTSHPADKWQKAAQYLPNQYQDEAAAAASKQKDAVRAPSPPATIKETFKQTSGTSKLGGPRRYAKPEFTIHDKEGSRQVPTLSPAPPNAQTQPSGPFSTASPLNDASWKQASESTVRIPDGSLNPAHGGLPVQQPPIAPPITQKHTLSSYPGTNFPAGPLAPILEGGDQSPPPPEVSSFMDHTRPAVRLPAPPPVVKLPPVALASPVPHNAAIMPAGPRQSQLWGPPGASRPIVMNEAWQARFNGLFNRAPIQTEVPPSPPRTPPKSQDPVLAVAASSKTQLDDQACLVSATVSLPHTQQSITMQGVVVDGSIGIESKPTIDDMFTEELSFGSLPLVQLPRNPRYDRVVYNHKPQFNMLKFQSNSKLHKAVEAQSKPQLDVIDIMFKHHAGYFLKVPGSKLNNRLVKHIHIARKMGELREDRKQSRKHQKGKDSNAPRTDVPTASSRNADGQKQPPPIPGSPAVGVNKGIGETGRKKTEWAAKGLGRNPPLSTIKS